MDMYRDKRFTLRESTNDGTLEFQKGDPQGPWQNVTAKDRDALMVRERKRQDDYNTFVGSLSGRPAVIFGTGPQLKRVTREQILFLLDQNVALIGVNAMPKWCHLAWKLKPSDVFTYIVGADAVGSCIHEMWAWDLLGQTPRFQKYHKYAPPKWPLISCSCPSDIAYTVYWADSITAAINLTLIAQATNAKPKICAGPYRNWPEVRMIRADGARIVLIGVEHNVYNHAYTDDKRFLTADDTLGDWPNMKEKIKGHKVLRTHAREVGGMVFNAAPWSLINVHPFCDFEESFNIPQNLRTGVTSQGIPELQKRVRDIEVDKKYMDGRIKGRKVKPPPGYVNMTKIKSADSMSRDESPTLCAIAEDE